MELKEKARVLVQDKCTFYFSLPIFQMYHPHNPNTEKFSKITICRFMVKIIGWGGGDISKTFFSLNQFLGPTNLQVRHPTKLS